MKLLSFARTSALFALAAAVSACESTTVNEPEPTPETIEVGGTWDDNFGGTTTISNEKWGSTTVTKFDNTTRFAITQNPATAEYFPGKFSKYVWTALKDNSFYYCTVEYGKDTAAEAENTTKVADANDLNGAGCGGFPWTKMVPSVEKIALIGTWDDTYGFSTTITKSTWGDATIVKFNNATRFAVTQNPADANWNPSKFNKLVWTAPQGNSFYYCTVDFGKDTAAEAENTANVADSADLDGKGCGGFPWTKYVAHSPFEVAGTWTDEFSTSPTVISATMWGQSAVIKYNNASRHAILQNPADDEWNPSKFAKFVWTPVKNGSFFYCTIEFGKETAEDAENGENFADPSKLETTGCGGFQWTKMTLKTN